MFAHPRHEAAQKALPDLIVQLRAAANVKDGYELQQELIGHVRETEEARNAFSKAIKRMQDGKSPLMDAPEPQSDRDPSLLETWQFERGVCERVARQFRCVGDALATATPPVPSFPGQECSSLSDGPRAYRAARRDPRRTGVRIRVYGRSGEVARGRRPHVSGPDRNSVLHVVASGSATADNGDAQIAVDIDGTYLPRLAAAGHIAVLVRPDHYLFGAAAAADEVPRLVADLRRQLGAPAT